MTREERANYFTNEAARLLGDVEPEDYQTVPIATLEQAGELLESAYKIMPNHWRTIYNVANIRDELSLAHGGPFVSAHLYEQALRLRVTPDLLLNKARILDIQEGRHLEAIRLYKRAAIQECHARAAIALGPCTLMQACRTNDADTWREGWYWLEYRKGARTVFNHPARWRGEDLAGKKLLVAMEAGLGDQIWAMRWLKRAKALGAEKLVVVAPESMVRLCKLQPYIDEVHVEGDGAPIDVDYMTYAMSMAGHLDPESRDRTAGAYITPPSKISISSRSLRVGLFWHGSVDRGYPAWRNVPFELLPQYLPGDEMFEYVSLQKGVGQIPGWLRASSIDDESIQECKDVADTAALVQTCDLVVTIGSMMSMLAPAVGVETWVLNTFNSAWQFGPPPYTDYAISHRYDECDPLWFHNLRQFRRRSDDMGWERVVAMVSDALKEKLQ